MAGFAALALLWVSQDAPVPDGPRDRIRSIRILAREGAPGIEKIAPYLEDEDVEVRLEAAKAIGDIGTNRALDPLLPALADPAPEVQTRVTAGIVNFYAPGYLKASSSRAAEMAIEPWIEVRPEVVEAFGKALSASPNLEVRANLARALGVLRGRAALDDLHAALRSKDTRLIGESLIALEKIRDPRSAERVAFLFRDPDENIASRALELAGLLRAVEQVPEIESAYARSTSAKVQRSAVLALALIGDPRGKSYFVQALESKDDGLRAAAAEGLGRLGDLESQPRLAECLQEERKMPPRLACAFGLAAGGRLETGAAGPLTYLVDALNSRSWRGVAEAYLAELARKKRVRAILEQAAGAANKEQKLAFARILAAEGDAETIAVLERLSRDGDADVVEEGMRALRSLKARLR
jgi:HEAT repeat protein